MLKLIKNKHVFCLAILTTSTLIERNTACAMFSEIGCVSRHICRKIPTIKRTHNSISNLVDDKKITQKTLGECFKERLTELNITGQDTLLNKAKKLKNIKTDREVLTSRAPVQKSVDCIDRHCYKTFLSKFPDNDISNKISETARSFSELGKEASPEKLRTPNFREDFVQLGYGWSKQVEELNKQPMTEMSDADRDEIIISLHNVNVLKYQISMLMPNIGSRYE